MPAPAPGSKPRKELVWIASARKAMRAMPDDVKDVFGAALLDAQYGDTPDGARAFGEGLPTEIMKLVEDYDGDTYRAAYTVAFAGVVYVLDVFQKKAKRGKATPDVDKARVLERYRRAREDHERNYRSPARYAPRSASSSPRR